MLSVYKKSPVGDEAGLCGKTQLDIRPKHPGRGQLGQTPRCWLLQTRYMCLEERMDGRVLQMKTRLQR